MSRHAFAAAFGGVSCALVLSACSSHDVSLDASPVSMLADAGPGTELILDRTEAPILSHLALDDERLYWIDYVGKVQSCRKDACASTVQTYASSNSFSGNFAIGGEYLYWLTGDGTIFTCPRSGCPVTPFRVFQDPEYQQDAAPPLAADADNVYWPASSGELYRCPVSGCGGVPELVATAQSVSTPIIAAENAYFMATAARNNSIEYAPTDGSTPARVVVTLPKISLFGVRGTDVFWSDSDGQVSTCSSTSCASTTSTVLPGISNGYRGAFSVVGDTLYWQELAVQNGPVRSCQIATCGTSAPATPVASNALSYVVDDQSLYWVDTNNGAYGSAIRRLTLPF